MGIISPSFHWWYELYDTTYIKSLSEWLTCRKGSMNSRYLVNMCLFPLDIHWLQTIFQVVVQLISHVQHFVTPWTAAYQAPLFFTISWNLLKLMFIESMRPSNHLIICLPLLFLSLNIPRIRVVSSERSFHIRWPKFWSFSISLSIENSGLISFRIDWFDLLAVQRTLKSLFQHHSSKASVLWCSAFFMVQLSHPYIPTGKIILIRWTFVGTVISAF